MRACGFFSSVSEHRATTLVADKTSASRENELVKLRFPRYEQIMNIALQRSLGRGVFGWNSPGKMMGCTGAEAGECKHPLVVRAQRFRCIFPVLTAEGPANGNPRSRFRKYRKNFAAITVQGGRNRSPKQAGAEAYRVFREGVPGACGAD